MTNEETKQLNYTVLYGQLLTRYNTDTFMRFSSLDSVVLGAGDRLLDSLGLKDFKRFKGAEAYQIEVNYYHGYPKSKKFPP